MYQTRPHLVSAGLVALDGYQASTEVLRSVVRAPTSKGAVSAAMTPLVHPALTRYCRVCKATHVGEMVLRATALPAGLELEPGTSPPVLVPRAKASWPTRPSKAALQKLITAYLTLLGPAGPSEVAGYLETRRADIEPIWPAGLTEVSVDGSPAWMPAAAVGALTAGPPAELVRLLNPFDPYLQARDRDLIVPDRAAHKVLWPVLGRPGVVLVDGEVLGVWRPRSSGKKLTVTVEALGPLPSSTWTAIEDEAVRIGMVRGVTDVRVLRAGA
jgi:hypothetical protein